MYKNCPQNRAGEVEGRQFMKKFHNNSPYTDKWVEYQIVISKLKEHSQKQIYVMSNRFAFLINEMFKCSSIHIIYYKSERQ